MTRRKAQAVAVYVLCAIAIVATVASIRARHWERILAERRAFEPERQAAVLAKARALGQALEQYQRDSHIFLPDADRWEEQLRPYLPAGFSFELPLLPGESKPRRFAMNRALDGLNLVAVPGNHLWTIVFFESTSDSKSAADDLRSLPPNDGVTGYGVVHASGRGEYAFPSQRDQILARADAGPNPFD